MDLFGTAGIRGPVTEVTPALALSVGRAVGRDAVSDELDARPSASEPMDAMPAPTGGTATPPGSGTVVVARDGRTTGESLAAAVVAGATSAGAHVLRAGMAPTPALAATTRGRYGVMVTASHNPPEDNGLKLFADGREYDRAAEQHVQHRVADDVGPTAWDTYGTSEQVHPLRDYRDAVVDYASSLGGDPAGLPVTVDCGAGMGSLATPQVLAALGADVTALHANVDGRFRARDSKPSPESLGDLRAFVADGPAEIGLAHDGDADRIVVVDSEGDVVHEDTVLAVLAEHYTRASGAADPVVLTTPNASARVDERVEAAGGRTERVRLGGLHDGLTRVRETGTAGTEVVFAAEPWKHVHPAFGEWIDGIASAAVFVRLVAAEGLSALVEPVTERPYRKVSVACPDDRKPGAMETLGETLPGTFPEATVDTEYGIRLDLPDGSWTLVRPSGTEPAIRIYAESESVDDLVETVRERVEAAVGD